jgi:general stress protein YciG
MFLMPSSQKDRKKGSSQRGFAGMDEEQQREISAKGGRAAHQSGNAHEFDSEEAREAGRKGGQASHASSRGQQNKGSNRNESSNRNEEEENEEEGSSSSRGGGSSGRNR